MNYLISILLIIIIITFGFFKSIIINENFEDSNTLDMYVITLGKQERLENIKNQQQKINNKIELYNGVIGLNLNVNELIKNNIVSENHNLSKNTNHAKREIGVYLSHHNIYKKIKENNKKGYTIIFEDDFLINSDNLIVEIKKAINTLNNKNIDFDFLFLGTNTNNYGVNIVDNLYNVDINKNLWGLHGYLVNNKNIDKIIDKTKQIDRPIDVIIQDLSYNKIFNTIIIYPYLINFESNFKSTVDNDTDII